MKSGVGMENAKSFSKRTRQDGDDNVIMFFYCNKSGENPDVAELQLKFMIVK